MLEDDDEAELPEEVEECEEPSTSTATRKHVTHRHVACPQGWKPISSSDGEAADELQRKRKKSLLKNKLIHIIRIANKSYNSEQLNKLKHDLSKTWKFLNTIIGRKPKVNTFPDHIIHDNKCLFPVD